MIIHHLTLGDFGSLSHWEGELDPAMNILDSAHSETLSTAIDFLLCSNAQPIPPDWIRPNTCLRAEVELAGNRYQVAASADQEGLSLSAQDPKGKDVTALYCNLLSHCPEQDATDRFDGRDKSFPARLSGYWDLDRAPENLSERTARLADTHTFRACLLRYIKSFQPEPIHNRKNYQTAIDAQGKFYVRFPGIKGKVYLSETEEKLFRYICFLNISSFWADLQQIRDLHHEKKPLRIQNFLEFLDESTNLATLMERTRKLQRQIMIFTPPLQQQTKQHWLGKDGLL